MTNAAGASDIRYIIFEMAVTRAAANVAATVTAKLKTYVASSDTIADTKFVANKAGFVEGKDGTAEALVAPPYDVVKKFEWAYYFAVNYGNTDPAFNPSDAPITIRNKFTSSARGVVGTKCIDKASGLVTKEMMNIQCAIDAGSDTGINWTGGVTDAF